MVTKIRGVQIKDADVAAAQLASNAVTTVKILDANVTAGKLATDAVETVKIKNLNVTTGKLAADAVDGTKLADNAVDSEHITAGSVDNAHLAGSIADSKLNTITTASKVSGSAVQLKADSGISDDTGLKVLLDGSTLVVGASGVKVGSGAITATEIATNAVGGLELNAGVESNGYVLTSDGAGGLTWTAKSSIGEDYIQEAEIQKVTFAGDDVTVEFDVGDIPVANSVQVYLNGLLQESGSGKDFTLATDKVTFSDAPITGSVVQIHSIKT